MAINEKSYVVGKVSDGVHYKHIFGYVLRRKERFSRTLVCIYMEPIDCNILRFEGCIYYDSYLDAGALPPFMGDEFEILSSGRGVGAFREVTFEAYVPGTCVPNCAPLI